MLVRLCIMLRLLCTAAVPVQVMTDSAKLQQVAEFSKVDPISDSALVRLFLPFALLLRNHSQEAALSSCAAAFVVVFCSSAVLLARGSHHAAAGDLYRIEWDTQAVCPPGSLQPPQPTACLCVRSCRRS